MPYSDHFKLADDFISHIDDAIGGIADPFIKSRYVGFIAVSAATVFELALKDVLCSFATRKHRILGTFSNRYFRRINGQIGRDQIETKYLPLFGDKYVERFRKGLDIAELATLKSDKVSIKSSYANLLTWRHGFAHEGTIPANATYEEVKKSYLFGRKLIDCLAAAMRR